MKRAREEDLLQRVNDMCRDADDITVDMAMREIREHGFEVRHRARITASLLLHGFTRMLLRVCVRYSCSSVN